MSVKSPESSTRSRMLELRAQGLTNIQIAQELGISRQRVHAAIGPAGPDIGRTAQARELESQVCKLSGEHVPATEIARRVGRSEQQVYSILRKNHIKTRQTNADLFKQGLRRCYGECHRVKSIKEFGRDQTNPQGLNARCHECDRRARLSTYHRQKEAGQN